MKRIYHSPLLPGILTGLALGLSFPPLHLSPLAWCAFVPLLLQCRDKSAREVAGRFFFAGWVFYSVLLQWLLTNTYWAGGWAIVGYQALCLYLSVYWVVGGVVWRIVAMRRGPWAAALALAMLWPVLEYLQDVLFSGFGWGMLAYGQVSLVGQWSYWIGPVFISFFVLGVNAMSALALQRGRWYWLAAVLAGGVYLSARLSNHALSVPMEVGSYEPIHVGVVQTDFPLEMKWDREYTLDMVENAVAKSRRLPDLGQVDIIVWPESVVMSDVEDPEIVELLESLCRDTGAWLLAGGIRIHPETGAVLNSSVLVSPTEGLVSHYDKVHLVPFGEYTPFANYFPWLGKVVPAIGDVRHGEELHTLKAGDLTLGPLICFEVLFGGLAKAHQAEGVEILAVMTNLGWFGMSGALSQELEIARTRAIQTRTNVIHAANTGISGLIDPLGDFEPIRNAVTPEGSLVTYRAISGADLRGLRLIGVLQTKEPPLLGGSHNREFAFICIAAISLMLMLFLPKRKKAAS